MYFFLVTRLIVDDGSCRSARFVEWIHTKRTHTTNVRNSREKFWQIFLAHVAVCSGGIFLNEIASSIFAAAAADRVGGGRQSLQPPRRRACIQSAAPKSTTDSVWVTHRRRHGGGENSIGDDAIIPTAAAKHLFIVVAFSLPQTDRLYDNCWCFNNIVINSHNIGSGIRECRYCYFIRWLDIVRFCMTFLTLCAL